MMKKNLTIFVWALFALSLSLTTGCSKDNSTNDSGDGGDGGGTYTGKLVSRIDEYDVHDGDHENPKNYTEFTYDTSNRLVKQVDKYGQETYTSTFSYPNSNTMIIQNSGINEGNTTMTATLNSSGYITKVADEKGKEGTELFYDNGYIGKFSQILLISEETSNENVYKGDTHIDTVYAEGNYTWGNGNLKTVQTQYNSVWQETVTYTYGATLNNHGNLDINTLFIDDMGISPFGWFGKASNNLISQINNQSKYDKDSSLSIRYETDADGYVTKIYTREDNGTEYLKYKITYK